MSRRYPHRAQGRRIRAVGAAALALTAIAAFAPGIAAGNDGAAHASAELRDTAGNLVGWARFTEDATGTIHVNVHVKGLAPGLHGTHVHANGVCQGPTFGSAGSHYNPATAPHGSHAGDLPNLTVNPAGIGHLNTSTNRAALSEFVGRALIIHHDVDDFTTQPTGASGTRIACGVIV